ncbi:MAG: DUF5319 family protein [Corynebacterium sp.]|nr:DUF5319 family protein [Corynebacterium sp.]
MDQNHYMPKDPFADDPNDPARLAGDDQDFVEITAEDRELARQDLVAVREYRRLLEPMGVRGIHGTCPDCDADHYYDWDFIVDNTMAVIAGAPLLVHEDSATPNPEAYVSWEYAMGYTDAMHTRLDDGTIF